MNAYLYLYLNPFQTPYRRKCLAPGKSDPHIPVSSALLSYPLLIPNLLLLTLNAL